jgi:hypothetical protein
MPTVPQSEWRSLARLEFPDAQIIGDGPYALIPCFPRAKAFLFQTLADAQRARRGAVLCSPFCCQKHNGMVLRPPKTAASFRSPADIERD